VCKGKAVDNSEPCIYIGWCDLLWGVTRRRLVRLLHLLSSRCRLAWLGSPLTRVHHLLLLLLLLLPEILSPGSCVIWLTATLLSSTTLCSRPLCLGLSGCGLGTSS
jgi:hypothetical protein